MSTFEQTSSVTRDIQIEPNPRFEPMSSNGVIGLKNIANTSEFHTINAQNSSFDNFTFQRNFQADTFLNMGVNLRITLPLKFKRTTDPTVTPTAANYVDAFFEDYTYLALRQYGLLNCIDTYALSLNGTRFDAKSVPELAKTIFPYYSETDVNEFFEASTADRFPTYDCYNGSLVERIKVPRADGTAGSLTIPIKADNDENIFTGGYKQNYNTRKPLIVFDKYDSTTKYLHGSITLETFLPFTLFGLPTESNGLCGVTEFTLSVALQRIQTAARLFSNGRKFLSAGPPITSENFLSDIQIDTSSTINANNSSILIQVISPPTYVQETMRDELGMIKSYVMGYSKVEERMQSDLSVPAEGSAPLRINVFNTGRVPKSIYVAAIKKKDGTAEKISSTTDSYGRIENLRIVFNGNHTLTPADAMGNYLLAKKNGLNYDKEMSLYTGGFPLKLDVSEDVGVNHNLFIGQMHDCQIDIRGTIQNLESVPNIYSIYIVLVYDAFIEFEAGKFYDHDSLVVDPGISNRQFHIDLYNQRMRKMALIGGAWYNDVWNTVKKVAKTGYDFVKDNPEVITLFKRAFLGAGGDMEKLSMSMQGGKNVPNIMGGDRIPSLTKTLGGAKVVGKRFK